MPVFQTGGRRSVTLVGRWNLMDLNTVSAVADSVAALGISLVVYQLALYKRELRDDHDRSRRENAVTYLMEWAKGLGRNASLTRRLVELLDEPQTKSLVALRPFSISADHRNLVIACLQPDIPEDELRETDGRLLLTETHVKIIKWQLVSYINLLESILSAWRHNTADREMIEEQFQYLVAPEKGMTLFEVYRKVVDGPHTLPAINEFAATILKRRAEEKTQQQDAALRGNTGKPPLGVKASKRQISPPKR